MKTQTDDNRLEVCEVTCEHEEITSKLRGLLQEEEIVGMAQIFKSLSDPNRVKIAFLLDQGKELCVCDIAALLDCSVATASHHLRQLKAAHITKSRKEGKNVYYSLKDHHIQTLITMTLEHQREKSDHE
ncbi:metalloregulator ArsR/SmtB family transcription factor [Paenibacillus sp. J22TS3]|uniref:ArsR/SmtB family transcription factor n=1 Tax=Paenibacillus sp. J22TS3 TaxID=2807192 RepID=UPI001B25495C|nr:metalloregulator ArsR/SmtB family transcription factor [Paenibacillus sp. J22TS3]GIP24644.1 transcriptional regulator [Paenibacillus sp. J22TS3]